MTVPALLSGFGGIAVETGTIPSRIASVGVGYNFPPIFR